MNEIVRVMPAAFKRPGSQGIANVRQTYSHDVVQSNIVNMTSGTPLAIQIKGKDSHDDYTGDVSVTARATNFQFVRADGIGMTGTSSQSVTTATGSSSTTTGVTGTASGSVGGHEGAPGGGIELGVAGADTVGGSASAGGTVTRGTGGTPTSVLFTCDIQYSITVRWRRSPRMGWSIASLGLVNLYSAVVDEDQTWGPYQATGPGAQVRFNGADCRALHGP